MECQVLVTESFRLLHDCSPEHLLGAHAVSPALMFMTSGCKILPDQFGDDRVLIQDLADSFLLFGPRVVHLAHYQGQLILLFLAHFERAPFLVLAFWYGDTNS